MYTENSPIEVLMIISSWFLRKKQARAGRNFPKKSHKNVHFIILHLVAEHLMMFIESDIFLKNYAGCCFILEYYPSKLNSINYKNFYDVAIGCF